MSNYRIPNARPIYKALRALGFTLEYDSKAGGCRTVGWEKTLGDRKLDLQLSDNSHHHRVSHFLNGGGPHRWRMSTRPSHFKDVDEMLIAIGIELTRTDHPPAL